MTTAQMKYYENNKDKVLAYKKQQYQIRQDIHIALKNIHIEGLSKRESDKVIKTTLETGNRIRIKFLDKYFSPREFMSNYTINNKIIATAYIDETDDANYIVSIMNKNFDTVYCLDLILQLPIVNKTTEL